MPNNKKELAKAYNANLVEDSLYKKWDESGYFSPKIDPAKKPFVIMMPPPNATGTLHLGHATMLALEDIMVRYHRMKGDPTLWLPGTDHAAIATQNKVEKVIAEQGLTRQKLGRDLFLDRVNKFVKESQATIRNQVRKMGSSCDWNRERYTLDEGLTAAVQTIFVKMHEDGLIYRGHRIVNWCKRCSSTLADDEVVYAPAKANMYYIKYGPLTVATVRPETKFGDTAVAVNPTDKRYKKYIGKTIRVKDVLGESDMKVIGDKAIDPNFGTGALKVTPAHDQVDFAMGQRHGLEVRPVIDETGRMNSRAGKYAGMSAEEAREKVVADLKEMGLLEKVEEYQHNVSTCYRCGTVIEPLVSLQWFVDVDKKILGEGAKKISLKEKSVQVVKSGEIKIVPERFDKVYYNWMENLQDWCISRQIWFGHRIPVWYCLDCYQPQAMETKIKDDHKHSSVKGMTVSIKQPESCKDCGGTKVVQDPDTLDTWFSSGLWTFSTLGWPNQTEDLKYFHPTSVLETGYDILFFWVARMILMTEYALGTVPFHTVYLHGLVRDDKGRKMSKSLGNIIDPLDMIAKFGTDAVRLSLIIGTTPGNDIRLSEEKIAGFRNFVNKLWNVGRFILMTAEPNEENLLQSDQPKETTLADKYILSRLNRLIKSTTEHIDKFEFSLAGEALFHFTWKELADWYLEVSKIEKNKEPILLHILKQILKLWHPYTPFISEELWTSLNQPEMLMVSAWPEFNKSMVDVKAEKDFAVLQEIVAGIRNLRQEHKIAPVQKLKAVMYGSAKTALIKQNKEILMHLGRLSELEIKDKGKAIDKAAQTVVEGVHIYVTLDKAVDPVAELKRLDKEIEETEKFIVSMETRLKNKEFVAKAPKAIVQELEEKLKLQAEKLKELKAEKEALKK